MTSTRLPSVPPPRGDVVPACPYVGLVPFNERDELFFFGRSEESDVIGANLMASRLTILYAPSGAGKSSVLRAGVLPRLRRRDEDDEELGIPPAAVAYVSAWSGPPLETIAGEILRAVPDAEAEASTAKPPTLSTDWLRELLETRGVPSIYLILDQFEEYFLYHPGDLGAGGLPGVLGEILRSRDLPVNVLLSIREDALAGLDRFKGYVPHLFDNYLRLSHLRREAGREAIQGPLDQYNRLVPPDLRMQVEPDLVEAVLNEVRTGQVVVGREETLSDTIGSDCRTDIEAPYLQLVLTRLWEQERGQGSSTLRRHTLVQLGGAQTIVQCHLDNVMFSLAPEQKDVAAAVFHHLVTASGSKIALAAEDLAGWSNLPTGPVRDLLESLSSGRQRILRPIPPATGTGGSTRYEIFHDVMGTAVVDWRRRYVSEQEQAAAERRLVAEREEARAAARAARRRLRRTRIVTASMALLLVIALVLLVLALVAYQDAREAQKRSLLSESARAADRNTELSLAKAVQAYEVKNDEDTREAVLAAASAPRSQVVAGPQPQNGDITAAGMLVTPDQRHVVAYGRDGAVRVVDSTGSVQAQTSVPGLTGAVITAAVAPDASRVALATDGGDVAIIDVATGHHVDIRIQGVPVQVFWMGSGDDSLVLIADASGAAGTYSARSAAPVASFPGHVAEVLPTTDGRSVIVSDQDDYRLRVWDARTGQKVAESSDLPLPPTFLRPYGSGVVGLLQHRAAEVVIWTWQDGPDPQRYPLGLEDTPGEFVDGWYVNDLAVHEQSAQVRVATENEVRWYSLDNGQLSGLTPPMDGLIYDVDMSQDGNWMATAGMDGLQVWNASLYRPQRPDYELRAHEGDVTQVEFLSGAGALVSRGDDGTIRLWQIGEATRFINHTASVWGIDLTGDGRWLTTASRDGKSYVLDVSLQSEPVVTVKYGSDLVAALFNPTDPHHLFTLPLSVSFPDAWEWDDTGQVTTPFTFEPAPIGPRSSLTSMAISRDGETLAAGDTDGAVHLWDARTGKLRSAEGLPTTGKSSLGVALDPRGEMLAQATESGIRLLDLSTGRERVLEFSNASAVVFDPSGDRLASMSSIGTVRIWDRQGEYEKDLEVSGDVVRSLAFSSDGTLIAGGTADGLVQVWNVKSGRTVMISRQHSARVNDVRFLPGDNSTLISASDDTYVVRWRCRGCTDPEGVVQDAIDWVHDNQ